MPEDDSDTSAGSPAARRLAALRSGLGSDPAAALGLAHTTTLAFPTMARAPDEQGGAARLVALAEPYYRSSLAGIGALPLRSAWSIATARGVYREIGRRVQALGPAAWDTRVATSRADKLRFIARGGALALLSRTWLPRLPATDTDPVVVPEAERAWVERAADRVARQVRRAGYPVVGDLADLAPRFASSAAVTGAELDHWVLDLAVRMLVEGGSNGKGEGR